MSDLLLTLSRASKLTPAEKLARTRELLASGAEVMARAEYGLTALHFAAQARVLEAVEIARLLLDAGADPNAVGSAGVSPLHVAVESNDSATPEQLDASFQLIDLLVERGARLPPNTPLAHYACAHVRMFERMYALGASIDTFDERGQSALHATVATQRPSLVEWLLAHGAALDLPDALSKTPLGIARAITATTPAQTEVRNRIIAALEALEAHGAPERVPGLAPFPIEALRAHQPEDFPPRILAVPIDSGAELVARLKRWCSPSDAGWVLELPPALLGTTTELVVNDSLTLRRPFFHHGDLVVHGRLLVLAPFLVTGTVRVHGVMSDAGPDSWVAIGGNLEVLALDTDGDFMVNHDLVAREFVHGYYNDHTLHAAGIKAPVVIMDDHECEASVDAEVFFDSDEYDQGQPEAVQAVLRDVLVPEVFDEARRFDSKRAFQRLAAGAPIRRERQEA